MFLIDQAGKLVTSNRGVDEVMPSLTGGDPGLAAAIARSDAGFYQNAGIDRYYSLQRVEGTRLTLVASVATASIYQPVAGYGQWLPWIVLFSLAGCIVYLVRVLWSLGRSQASLARVSLELQSSNRELADFAGIASHDLQEPLRKIRAFGDRLAERAGDALDVESTDFLRRMQGAAERMQSLIHDLLEYSRVAGQSAELERVDLDLIVASVVSDLEDRIRTSGAQVVIDPLPTVWTTALGMRQVFQNLIANALKFRRDGVPLVVVVTASASPRAGGSGRSRGQDWEIRVADNGVGFEARYSDRLFQPFQRLHGRQAFEGTGMGLAICRRVVERNGGIITATSRVGEGSTFTFTLPARPAPRDPVMAATAARAR